MNNWQISNLLSYVATILVAALMIRIIISLLTALERWDRDGIGRAFCQHFYLEFRGTRNDQFSSNYWYGTVLGALELSVYPIFMAANFWAAIAFWLSFKTLSRWSRWKEDSGRTQYIRFLIGNALVLVAALVISRWWVKIGCIAPCYQV